jgi:hypothetical protein
LDVLDNAMDTLTTVTNDKVVAILHNHTDEYKYITQGAAIAKFYPLKHEHVLVTHSSGIGRSSHNAPIIEYQQDSPRIDSMNQNADQDSLDSKCITEIMSIARRQLEFNTSQMLGDEEYKSSFVQMLNKHTEAFVEHDNKIGLCMVSPHKIKLKEGAIPSRSIQYRYHPEVKRLLKEQLDMMLEEKIVEINPHILFSSPLVAVKKNCKKSHKHLHDPAAPTVIRPCLDLRLVNAQISFGQGWPVPSVQSVIDTVAEHRARVFSTIDCRHGEVTRIGIELLLLY